MEKFRITKTNYRKGEIQYEDWARIKLGITQYQNACNNILKLFCKKHNYEFNEDLWTAGEVGTIALCDDVYVDLQDMITDLRKMADEDEFLRWYDYSYTAHLAGVTPPNYRSWLSGCPRYSEEELNERIKSQKDDIKDLISDMTDIMPGDIKKDYEVSAENCKLPLDLSKECKRLGLKVSFKKDVSAEEIGHKTNEDGTETLTILTQKGIARRLEDLEKRLDILEKETDILL